MGLDVLHGSPALLLCGVLMLGTAVWGLTEVERVPEEQVFVLDDAAPSHSQYFETSIEQNMIWVQLLVDGPALSKDTVGLEILFYNVIEMSTPLLHLSYSVESIQRLLDEEMFFSWGPCPAELLAYTTDEDGGLVTSSASLTTMDGTWVMEALLVQPDGTDSTLSFRVVVGSGATAIDVGTRYSDSFATTNLYYTLEAPSVAGSMLILSIANLNESLPLSSWLRALYWRKDSCPDVTAGGGNQTFLQGSVMAGPTVDIYLGAVDEASYLAFGVWSSFVAGSNGSDAFTLAYQTIEQNDSPGISSSDESQGGSQAFVNALFVATVGITFGSIVVVIVVVIVYAFLRTRQWSSEDPDEPLAAPLSVNTSEQTPIVGSVGAATLRYVE